MKAHIIILIVSIGVIAHLPFNEVSFPQHNQGCNFYIPKAFTTNGDSKNDTFGPTFDCPVSDYTMTIYDRWGEMVYVTDSLEAWWDGKNIQTGTDASEGTFIWILSFRYIAQNKTPLQKQEGLVTLMR